ncbi:glycosyltransferase family 2 protein [Winogradskyella forsetii]|uniref:glycosyltransferase family 2 protein n=1 Tax=Winogradskyella forsetii TaxID=2686077 RepID=UPI0015BCF802|nr:glycosyltransferase family 2 protein [Winogradskyella forsetii]
MAFFSVIISVYNKEKYIKHTIESVLNQSFVDYEIIIVNDGSTDKSEAVIKSIEDQRIRLITTQNQGASKARNTGMLEASSNYFALLDGDDSWDSSYLQHMHDAICRFPDIKIFTAGVSQKYNDKVVPVEYSFNPTELYSKHNYFKASKKYTLITSSSVVFHESILAKTGLFDTSLISGEDTDLWIRFGLYFDILFINKQLANYNYDASSLSNTTFDLNKKPKFDKYFDQEKENPLLKRFLDRNRYSMAILSKLKDDTENFLYFRLHLNTSNLKPRQRLLLKSPKWLLLMFLKLQSLKGERLIYPHS